MTFGRGGDRYRRNRAAGVEDKAIALHGSGEHNDEMAKAAEDHFAILYGLKPSNNRRPTDAEFLVRDASIDVKWTPYEHGMLIHAMSSRTRATFYVLVVGASRGLFRVAGWAWGFELHRSIVGPPKLRVPTYALPQDRLRQNLDIQMATLYVLRRGEPTWSSTSRAGR